jgi:hypothetical protein
MFRNRTEAELVQIRSRLVNELKEIDAELKVFREQKKKKNSKNDTSASNSIFDSPNAILDMFFGQATATNASPSVSTTTSNSSSLNEREYKKLEDLNKEQLKSCLRHIDISFKTSDSKDDLMQKIRNVSKVNTCLDYINQNGTASAAAASNVSSSISNIVREEPRKATKVEQSVNKKVASKKEEKSERITSIDDCKKAILQDFMNKNDIKFKTSDNKDDLIEKIRNENKVRLCLDFVNK